MTVEVMDTEWMKGFTKGRLEATVERDMDWKPSGSTTAFEAGYNYGYQSVIPPGYVLIKEGDIPPWFTEGTTDPDYWNDYEWHRLKGEDD